MNHHNVQIIAAAILSALVLGADFTVAFMLFDHAIPEASKDLAQVMFGGINIATGMVIQFWIGSSRSGNSKDETIAHIAKGLGDGR